jgi:hypothetical protein
MKEICYVVTSSICYVTRSATIDGVRIVAAFAREAAHDVQHFGVDRVTEPSDAFAGPAAARETRQRSGLPSCTLAVKPNGRALRGLCEGGQIGRDVPAIIQAADKALLNCGGAT